jgi:hypothetical protein
MNENIKQELYRIVDHFLTEAKNQNGEERSLDRLNADRHLAVENLEALFARQKSEIISLIYSMILNKEVDDVEASKIINKIRQ